MCKSIVVDQYVMELAQQSPKLKLVRVPPGLVMVAAAMLVL